MLRATTKNTSDRDLELATSLGLTPPDTFRYEIHVMGAGGRPAPPSARILENRKLEKEGKPVLAFPPSSSTLHILKPGESFVDEINVTDKYDLSRPGLYAIWLVRPVPTNLTPYAKKKYWKGSVRSNTITVTVVK